MASGQHPAPDRSSEEAAARDQRLAQLHTQLAEGVAAIRDDRSWRSWLDVAARFHHYSFNNQVLIAAQKPDATLVAGYRTWQGMGRQVRKGESALWVLAPVTRRRRPDADPIDAEALNAPTTSVAPGTPDAHPDWSRGRVLGFRGAPVFDITQTEGDPLPTPPRPNLLAGEAPPGLWSGLAQAIAGRGFTVARCADSGAIGGANGQTDFTTRTVTVRGDVDEAHAVKTLAHEAGHVLLHDPTEPTLTGGCRGLIEVEAESVAYLVAAHHGLDTAGYTFAYIAGWAGRDEASVQRTATRVLAAAKVLIEATERPTATDVPAASPVAQAVEGDHGQAREHPGATGVVNRRLPPRVGDPGRADELRQVLDAAQAWFLAQAAGSRTYETALTARGHSCRAGPELGVGYAPATWTGLVDHLRRLGHPDGAIVDAGLAVRTRRGHLIDRFRARVTFPIHDQRSVVGFTARDTSGAATAAKYLNSPASELYDKGRLLFGTQHRHPARTTAVLVEGPWDALAVTASGPDAVGLAACGTAVTPAHLALATAGRRRLLLAPDPDPGGLASLDRTLTQLAAAGRPLPEVIRTASDLAGVYATAGPAGVSVAVQGAVPAGLAYAELHLNLNPSGTSPEARVAAARAAATHGHALPPGDRVRLANLLVERLGLTADAANAVLRPDAGLARLERPVAGLPRQPAGVRAARSGPS